MHNLFKNAKIVRVANAGAGAASATPTKATIIDADGYDGVCFIAALGNVLDTAQVSLKAASAAANDTNAMVLITGAEAGHSVTGVAADATSHDNKLVVLDVPRPPNRYVEAQIFHVVANAPFDGIIAILYRGDRVPVTPDASVVASATYAG